MKERKLGLIKYFIGIDISKATFNYCLRYGGDIVVNGKVGNSIESIKEFLLTLKQIPGFKLSLAVFGVEVTGVYGLMLINTLSNMKAKVIVEPAIKIKNSLGIVRGKNDKLDAARIARYLIKNIQELKPWTPRRKIIDELSSLSTLRERIVRIRGMINTPLLEDRKMNDPKIAEANMVLCEDVSYHVGILINNIDSKIKQLWQLDDRCNRLMTIMLSIYGIGDVTALQIMIHSNEFKTITTARTFASYCGVAPFEHSSGTSVKKTARVSHVANKRIKALLHSGVRVCIAHDPEIKAYYRRRVDLDKKGKLATMNAVKFKLICRVFACVRADRLYERGYVSKPPKQ